jgi:hypothetical protein
MPGYKNRDRVCEIGVALSMNLTLVGTSRCDVPARATAGGKVAPLHAARTAQRAIPTRFRSSGRKFFGEFSPSRRPSEGHFKTDLVVNLDFSHD